MKWYGPPPWLTPQQDKTSDWEKFLKFQRWTEKQEKKRKQEQKEMDDAKKKKEAEADKWPTFSTAQMCIILVALGPPVGILTVIFWFVLLKKLGEVIGIK